MRMRHTVVALTALLIAGGVALAASNATQATGGQPGVAVPDAPAALSKLDCGKDADVIEGYPSYVIGADTKADKRHPAQIMQANIGGAPQRVAAAAANSGRHTIVTISPVSQELTLRDADDRIIAAFQFEQHPQLGTVLEQYAFCAN